MITVIGYHHNTGRLIALPCNLIEWGYEFYLVPVTGGTGLPAAHELEPMEWRTVEWAYVGLDSGQYSGDMVATDLGNGVMKISYTGGSGSGSA